MYSEISSAPDLPVQPLPLQNAPLKPQVARWRWWIALLILVFMPLLGTFFSAGRASKDELHLPRTVAGLLIMCALEVGTFVVFYGVAWAFSRASLEALFLKWRDGWKVPLWGLLYSLAMRFGIMVLGTMIMAIIAVTLAMLGQKPEVLIQLVKANSGGAEKVFMPAMTHGGPLYRFLMVTLVSFVVAGLREELWRAAMMASLSHLAPKNWSIRAQTALILGASSVLFGLAHLYQGWVGVVGTGLLGIALGAITLRHRSVWPTVIAHGCFDAASFLALLAVVR